jgi:exosome complex component RRP4
LSKVERRYVIPGDVIAEGNYRPESNVYRMGDKLYSLRVGLCEIEGNRVKVIPLSGPYVPKVDDIVVGIITEISAFAWTVDINSFFPAFLPAQSVFGRRFNPERDELGSRFRVGDAIVAVVAAFDRSKDPMLSVSGPRLGRVPSGVLIKISPVKVPRLIGRRGSMSKMIEDASGCRITIGQNGYIIVAGPPEGVVLAAEAIKMVEEQAHTSGLTEKIERFLAERLGMMEQPDAVEAHPTPAPVEGKAPMNEGISSEGKAS